MRDFSHTMLPEGVTERSSPRRRCAGSGWLNLLRDSVEGHDGNYAAEATSSRTTLRFQAAQDGHPGLIHALLPLFVVLARPGVKSATIQTWQAACKSDLASDTQASPTRRMSHENRWRVPLRVHHDRGGG